MKAPALKYQKIFPQPDGWVLLVLTERPVAREVSGEVILQLNDRGNWVHGFEIVGGFTDFSVEAAARPFNPQKPDLFDVHPRTSGVTYDPQADAAFFYLEYEPAIRDCSDEEWEQLMRVSHGICPIALCGLDQTGGLVWVKIPIADASAPTEFLKLLKK